MTQKYHDAECNFIFMKANMQYIDPNSPELSLPFSGLPLEYIVANFPSSIKRNQPFDPLDNSSAAESDQM